MYLAKSAMDFEGLVWKTRPGAWDVEPPGIFRGPWSRTVMLFQPRVTSSSARFVPTIPAPIMTMLGVEAMWFLLLLFVCCLLMRWSWLPEHDSAGLVQQHTVLAVPPHGAGQRQGFGIPSDR